MKSRSLLVQVLSVNLLLVAGTTVVAAIALNHRIDSAVGGSEMVVLGLALVATLLGNWLLLHRRFIPLDLLISAMERIDHASPDKQLVACDRVDSSEAHRLEAAINRMLARLEAARREAGRAAIQAQERERRRIAQDLHDEVNQALTAVSLRLQASIAHAPEDLRRELTETKRLAGQAMQELLALARQLRPAVLDDLGLLPTLKSQVRDFADQTGIQAAFNVRGAGAGIAPRAAAGRLPRDAGEPVQRGPAFGRRQGRRRAVIRAGHPAADRRRRVRLHLAARGWPGTVRHARARPAGGRPTIDLVGWGPGNAGGADARMSTGER